MGGITEEDKNDERRRRKERQYHYKSRKFSLQEYNQNAKGQSGSSDGPVRRISVQPEDTTLEEADLDDLMSHRSDDPRGMRRHRVQPPSGNEIRINRKDGAQLQNLIPHSKLKKMIDHSPHDVFVQLDELQWAGEEQGK